ncbi:hypothetical protein LTR56_026934 [Elasticomyces elasticus]|nr:hypothetical protein LTR56_026934 [Elasticomyces elasticus]KAK4899586.1 hypothetical protein LTR49_027629 [Elasticomyces elasticus]KAK5734030.1 hypothetical protein LTS12_026814 [Elasticomyces elasticus]
MFFGQPPVEFDGTNDSPGDTYKNFLPPITQPRDMLHHKPGYAAHWDYTSSSTVPQHDPSSPTGLKPVDTVPALFSSPHVVSQPRTLGDGTDMPDISRLNIFGFSDATYTDVKAAGRGVVRSNG